MYRRWVCNDVWMDIFPLFDHAQLGLKMALLSDRFDVLVDKHFDGRELTIWQPIGISKDIGPKPKLSVRIDGKWVAFPLPDRPLPNKIRFRLLRIEYIDHSVIAFLRSNKRSFDTIGTKLELFIEHCDQSIWDLFIREIWPIVGTNIRHLSLDDGDHLANLRRRISPTILTDLNINSIHSINLLPDGIADDEPNATAGQVLSKWLHTPSKNGQPKRLHCYYCAPSNLEWINSLKEIFLRATTSVAYNMRITFYNTLPIAFELVNERTNEKLTLEKATNWNSRWIMKRCPISEKAAAIQWKNDENWDDKLTKIKFNLWRGNSSIGPLSPSTEEEEADERIEN